LEVKFIGCKLNSSLYLFAKKSTPYY